MDKYKNLYELRKTIKFELKPNQKTLDSLNKEAIFESPNFKSKVFTKSISSDDAPAKKVKNFQFSANFSVLKNLVDRCDKKVKQAEQIKYYLEGTPNILWSVWIDPEKIKSIDKDLRYKLQKKKSWSKKFWNEKKEEESTCRVQWKRGGLYTLDDIDAYFEKIRSIVGSEAKHGQFTLQVLEKIQYFLRQYEIRREPFRFEDDLQAVPFLKKKNL